MRGGEMTSLRITAIEKRQEKKAELVKLDVAG